MNGQKFWGDLIKDSILNPTVAGLQITNLPLDRRVIPLGLALVAVLNGILYSALIPAGLIPSGLLQPIALAVLSGVVIFIGALGLMWVGQLWGGRARLEQMLLVSIWMQVLRLIVQVIVLVLGILSPPLAMAAAMVAGVWGLYILVCFVSSAQEFDNRLKGVATVALTFVAAVLLLSLALSVLGITPPEVSTAN